MPSSQCPGLVFKSWMSDMLRRGFIRMSYRDYVSCHFSHDEFPDRGCGVGGVVCLALSKPPRTNLYGRKMPLPCSFMTISPAEEKCATWCSRRTPYRRADPRVSPSPKGELPNLATGKAGQESCMGIEKRTDSVRRVFSVYNAA